MTVVRIPLANNRGFFTVDEADVPLVTRYRWQLVQPGGKRYAAAYIRKEDGKPSRVMAHRLLFDPGPDKEVDHRDGDGLNNVRSNLREATPGLNGANKKLGRNNTSGYKGVSLIRENGKWRTGIEVDRKGRYLGQFDTREEAARAYDAAAREAFGDYARTNFPLAGEDGPQRTIAMRDVTAAEKANYVIPARSSTGVRNVFLHARSGRYEVRVNIANVSCQCGYYGTFEEAREVADRIRARIIE